MAEIVVLSAPIGHRESGLQLARLAAIAKEDGWAIAYSAGQTPHLIVLTGGTQTTQVHTPPHGRLVLLGEWISDQTLLEATARTHEPLEFCRRLTDRGWGRYLALLLTPGAGLTGVYRDPSGALDCFVTDLDGVTVIATVLPAWLISSHPGRWRPDWDRVIDLLNDPTQVTGASAVEGWASVMPGTFQPVAREPGQCSTPVWTPAGIASQSAAPIEDAKRSLVRAVDRAVSGLAGGVEGCLVEVSGGLDSAIVATAVDRQHNLSAMTLVNYHGPYSEADERPYASSVAERIRKPLLAMERGPPLQIASAWIGDRWGFRPGFQRLDPEYDTAQAALAQDLGQTRIMTGKGGDAVFFQHCTPLVFADVMARQGPLSLFDPRLVDTARWCRQSVWSVGAAAFRSLTQARRGRAVSGRPPLPFVNSCLQSNSVHPWLADLDGITPAKRMQIAALASNIGLHGPTPQTDVCDVVHPLLSQPVLEAALGIPTIDLTEGGRDRGLARNTFADRLPDEIRLRRTKGSLAQYFGEAIMNGLPELRPFLLEGQLAQRGYIDRAKLEAALTADVLIWKAVYGDVMLLVMIEAWVRGWSQPGPVSPSLGAR